jgi:hypothetical protein
MTRITWQLPKTFLLLALFALAPLTARSESETNVAPSVPDNGIPLSTEIQIGKMLPLIKRAPKGAYVSIGGERSFRGASMHGKIEHLIIVDISPNVLRFALINKELLKAPTKEAYKQLRWESDFEQWQKVSPKLTQEDFDWWTQQVRNCGSFIEWMNRYGQTNFLKYRLLRKKIMVFFPALSEKFNNYIPSFLTHVTWADLEPLVEKVRLESLSATPEASGCVQTSSLLTKEEFAHFVENRTNKNTGWSHYIRSPSDATEYANVLEYKLGNYLFNDKQYQRLHLLSIQEKITVLKLDLREPEQRILVTNHLEKLNLKIAVLDLNNIYLFEYIGETHYRSILQEWQPVAQGETILILMTNYTQFIPGQMQVYLGFTFDHIKNWPPGAFLLNFLDAIPREILPEMNGKLYHADEPLPFFRGNAVS